MRNKYCIWPKVLHLLAGLTVKPANISVFHLYPFVWALHLPNSEKDLIQTLVFVKKPATNQERHFPYEDAWFHSMNTLVLATFEDRDFSPQVPVVVDIVLGRALKFVILVPVSESLNSTWPLSQGQNRYSKSDGLSGYFVYELTTSINSVYCISMESVMTNAAYQLGHNCFRWKRTIWTNAPRSSSFQGHHNHKLMVLPLSMASIGPRGTVSSDILQRFSHDSLLYINSCFSVLCQFYCLLTLRSLRL